MMMTYIQMITMLTLKVHSTQK